MTDLDQATQHDPAAERLARIDHQLSAYGGLPASDAEDLSAFARAVLAVYADVDPTCCDDCAERANRDVRDAAARHLGGGNG